jgi:phosphatidylinositol alpha-1,6-mannosyltransferase
MKLLALLTDAFGGRGGIAKFNRDLLTALCSSQSCESVIALPRVVRDEIETLPPKLDYRWQSASSKLSYVGRVLAALFEQRLDGVICGHLHLLPLAIVAARLRRVPVVLIVHGVEAWQRPARRLLRQLVRRVDAVVTVSEFTKARFLEWSQLTPRQVSVIPNCVDLDRYGHGAKSAGLLARYGLNHHHTVLLTLGRLSATERYKGVDEVMNVLPRLVDRVPSLAYLVVGEGDDLPRLRGRAAELGLGDRVIFAGHVDEGEKREHYWLADVFVMPGRGEGFGIVYLEALACGVPVVASSADASREAVRDGLLGEVVNPDDPEDLVRGILRAMEGPPPHLRENLAFFSVERFENRWQRAAESLFQSRADAASTLPMRST